MPADARAGAFTGYRWIKVMESGLRRRIHIILGRCDGDLRTNDIRHRRIAVAAPLLGFAATYYLLGFGHANFFRPAMVVGDHVWLLGMIKDAINSIGVYNQYLGAPSHQTRYAFPLFDGSYKALIWFFTRFTSNVFVVAHLVYVAGVGLMFSTSFWSLRVLRVGPVLAAVASVAFVVSPYFASRSYAHDMLALYYSVPMGAALALWLSDGDSLQKLKTPFGICAVVLVGSSGFYYAFFTAMFLGLSMTGATIEQRSLKPILVCAGVSVAFVFLLLLSAYSYHMVHLLDGGIVSPPKRARWEQFSHGLVVGSALQVYADIGLFVQRGAEFIAATPDAIRTGEGTFREWPGVFLTTVIIMAPIALFPLLQMHDKRLRRVALSLAFITFGLLFAMRFGLGSIFTFLFTGAIRAQARIMPFLSFFAIVALCLGCTAIEQRNKRALVGMIVGSLLLTGTYRAIFILSHKQNLYLAHRPERVSLSSLAGVLAAKDSAGLKMIFQMPVMSWPEVPPVKQLADGQHMLPYLFDNRGTRWSYGLSYKEVTPYQALASNPQGIVSALSQIGFDGILIEKRGYEPAEADTLISTLKENGACIKHDDEIRTLFEIGKTCS